MGYIRQVGGKVVVYIFFIYQNIYIYMKKICQTRDMTSDMKRVVRAVLLFQGELLYRCSHTPACNISLDIDVQISLDPIPKKGGGVAQEVDDKGIKKKAPTPPTSLKANFAGHFYNEPFYMKLYENLRAMYSNHKVGFALGSLLRRWSLSCLKTKLCPRPLIKCRAVFDLGPLFFFVFFDLLNYRLILVTDKLPYFHQIQQKVLRVR